MCKPPGSLQGEQKMKTMDKSVDIPASELSQESYKSFPELRTMENVDLKLVSSRLIKNLQKFRDICGIPMIPSPAVGALHRMDGSEASRHYAVGRLCDAIDIFPVGDFYGDETAVTCYLSAVSSGLFGAVGMYLDTSLDGEKSIMLHLDTRPSALFVRQWIRKDGRLAFFRAKYPMCADNRIFAEWLSYACNGLWRYEKED